MEIIDISSKCIYCLSPLVFGEISFHADCERSIKEYKSEIVDISSIVDQIELLYDEIYSLAILESDEGYLEDIHNLLIELVEKLGFIYDNNEGYYRKDSIEIYITCDSICTDTEDFFYVEFLNWLEIK